jgi:hypothetical protein
MTASTSTKKGTTAVDDTVARLRTIAKIDPQAAQDAVWAWIERLGAGVPGHAAEGALAQLFAAGTPAEVDGQTQGMLVGWTTAPADLDRGGRAVHAIARLVTSRLGLMPWLGKKFDRSAQRGTNSVSTAAAVITGLLAPGYRMRRAGDHWEGFDMLNRVEESVVSKGTTVLVLDYETVGGNPWPISRVRDEAVQIVPGVYLGAKLWHQDNGYRQLAWWVAKSPIPARP